LEGDYKVLHLSSTTLERKGTAKLLEAWKTAALPNATLFLSVPQGMMHDYRELIQDLDIERSVKITDRLNLSPSRMSGIYRSMNAVCQPSRGEGFGLVPLEARCCGTPAILTDCTGHSQHAKGPGIVLVRTGEDVPIDDFPGALAPSLFSDDIAAALVEAYEGREALSKAAFQAAKPLKKQWSWKNQLKEFSQSCLASKSF
jgi:glycosyltransferase involved in cell wall biosynthesis